jgi:CelD/BcsL family acetyltransferase involved in cellulose biosynthesis
MSRLVRAGAAGSRLTVSVLREMAELERLREDWEQLLRRSAGLHPSLTPTWLLTWWRVFGPHDGRRLRALAVHRGRELVGLLPLLERRFWHYRAVPLRRLELLASGEDCADEILSEYLGPIVASGQEDEVVDALAGALAKGRSTWHEIAFTALEGRSPAVQRLAPAFGARGLVCESAPFGECPYIALPKRWEDYVAALPSDDRYLVNRSLRDFDRWAGDSARVEVARGYEDLQRGKAILHQLHEERWQAGGKAGVFASPIFRRFHDLLMPALLDRGELDLRWLVAHGEPVAVSYSIVNDNRVYFYQGGRATSLPKGIRPGIVLHLRAIRAAIEAGRHEYDFLAGDARYKLQLATRTRPLVDLRVTRPSLPEAARIAVGAGRALLVDARAWARASIARRSPSEATPPPGPPARPDAPT